MSRFHSNVSRRDFMKGLGLTGAAIGAVGAIAPVYHDLDEVLASEQSWWKRPWYVKERELDNPTTELDWSMHKRFDHAATRRRNSMYFTDEAKATASAAGAAVKEAIGWNNYTLPGKQLRDAALSQGIRNSRPSIQNSAGEFIRGDRHYSGPKITQTPEERGVPKWQGTPEEATSMLRAAMRFFGATDVYPGELNGSHRNFVNLTDRKTPIVFEDVPDGYSDGKKHVLPGNKELFEIGFSIPENREAHRTGPTDLRSAANSSRYRIRAIVVPATQEFLRALGYICTGASAYPITSGAGAAVFHGSAEGCRSSWWVIDVERDPLTGRFELITDLHLAPTPPVDAGIWKFCHTCGHCADVCPSGSVTHDKEPTWDKPLSPYTNIPVAGQEWKKMFWTNLATCDIWSTTSGTGCYLCRASCTFMSSKGAMVHELTRATLATTPLFNGFFANMFPVFDYGQKNDKGELVGLTYDNYGRRAVEGQSWWDMSLPVNGSDSTMGARDHGYR